MTVSGRGQGSTLLPPDFQRRGVAVPFSTKLLFFARLRSDPTGQLEYLVPGLAGGLKTCIVPQGKIGETLSMTVFDRALMEELADLKPITPETVEQACLAVSSTGLGGSQMMRWARQRADLDRANILAMEAWLANALLEALGEKPVSSIEPEQGQHAVETAVKAALENHTETLQSPPDAIYSRIRQWAQILLPVGLGHDRVVGHHVEVLNDMERFAASLSDWLVPEPVGPAEMAQRIAAATRKTAATAQEKVDRVTAKLDLVLENIIAWDATWAVLRADLDLLANIIDGWPRLIRRWETTLGMERIDQREVIELFALFMPIQPRTGTNGTHEFWNNLREDQVRWNEALGTLDQMVMDDDLKEKIGSFKMEVT